MTVAFDYHSVSGDYQYRALNSGPSMQRFWHRGKLTMIDSLIRPHIRAGSRVLEVGCGAGNLLLRATTRGSYPVALDLAMESLTFVRSRLVGALKESSAAGGFGCAQGIGEQLPFASGCFDCVLLSEVIEHLNNPQMAVAEAARVLRPGGRLLVTTPNYRSFWPIMERAVDMLNMAPRMAGEQHISRFQPSSLRCLLIDSGLDIEYFGSIYGLSPFLSLAFRRWSERQLAHELERRSRFGMILVAVATRPVSPTQ